MEVGATKYYSNSGDVGVVKSVAHKPNITFTRVPVRALMSTNTPQGTRPALRKLRLQQPSPGQPAAPLEQPPPPPRFPWDVLLDVAAWADQKKESGMPQRQQRAFYSHNDWLQHRSSLRHLRHMLSSSSSRVILSLIPPVAAVTSVSVLIAFYNTAVNMGYLPSFFPLLHAASLPYELTAPALALLLVFRTDASYSRYDEARKTWNKVTSTARDFVRQSLQVIHSPDDAELKSALLSYILAFPISLKCHLTYGSDCEKELRKFLGDDDLAMILTSNHQPSALLQLMSETLYLLQIKRSQKEHLDDNISKFNSCISVCERLIRTPIPLSYTRFTSRLLVLWHLTLPIILWDSCQWLVVPATFFNAATLFCVEEVGVLIEEPFPMLALDKMISLLHEDIEQLMDRHLRAKTYLSSKKRSSFNLINNEMVITDYWLKP